MPANPRGSAAQRQGHCVPPPYVVVSVSQTLHTPIPPLHFTFFPLIHLQYRLWSAYTQLDLAFCFICFVFTR